jgi:hypothetical protein
MAVTFQAKVGDEPAFRPRHLAELFFQVGIDRNEARHCEDNGIRSDPFPSAF